jgi:hypothetical protein
VNAFCARIPGLLEAFGQQDCAPTLAGELWQQSEILDFDVVIVTLEVEVPGGRALKVRHEQAQFGSVAPVAPLFERPVQAVGPVPVATDGGVPEVLEFWCWDFGLNHLEIRDLKISFASVRFWYEFVAGIHLEIPDRVLHGSSVRDPDGTPQADEATKDSDHFHNRSAFSGLRAWGASPKYGRAGSNGNPSLEMSSFEAYDDAHVQYFWLMASISPAISVQI